MVIFADLAAEVLIGKSSFFFYNVIEASLAVAGRVRQGLWQPGPSGVNF
jgi:hypothetical protein